MTKVQNVGDWTFFRLFFWYVLLKIQFNVSENDCLKIINEYEPDANHRKAKQLGYNGKSN